MEINHIGLYVFDLEGTKAFFEKYFGAHAGDMYHNRKTDFKSYMLSFDGGARLEIMTRPGLVETPGERLRTGFIHLSLSVGAGEQVDALAAHLTADGYDVIDGPRTTGDGYYECCVVGVENNLIEITV